MSEESIQGTCVCRAVKYSIRPPFNVFQYCHCSRCRKSSGSAHAANLFLPAAQLSWEAGEQHVRRFELPDAKHWCHAFCDQCGSALPWLTRNGRAYIVPAGNLDIDPGLAPQRNVHFASRAPWYRHASELPIFDEEAPRPTAG